MELRDSLRAGRRWLGGGLRRDQRSVRDPQERERAELKAEKSVRR